jgi:hypothetical protein
MAQLMPAPFFVGARFSASPSGLMRPRVSPDFGEAPDLVALGFQPRVSVAKKGAGLQALGNDHANKKIVVPTRATALAVTRRRELLLAFLSSTMAQLMPAQSLWVRSRNKSQ